MYKSVPNDFDAMAANSFLSLSKFRLHEPSETDRCMIIRVRHTETELQPVEFLDETRRNLVEIMYKILKELVIKAETCRTLEYRINHMQMFLNESKRIDSLTREIFCRIRDILPINYTYVNGVGVLYMLHEREKIPARKQFGKLWKARSDEIARINTGFLRPLNDTYKAFVESRKIRLTANGYYESRFNIMMHGATMKDDKLQSLNNELFENTESIGKLLKRLRKVRDSLIEEGNTFETTRRLETRRYITSLVNYIFSHEDSSISHDVWQKYLMFPRQTATVILTPGTEA